MYSNIILEKRHIVFLCEELMHTIFIYNFENALKILNYDITYIVTSYRAYKYLKHNSNGKIIILRNKDITCEYKNALICKEYVENRISEEETVNRYISTYATLDNINRFQKIDMLIAGQCVHVSEIAFDDFAKNNSINILFFELANIPGKTFFDIFGSNAKSLLCLHPEILDEETVSDEEYERWKNKYLIINLKNHEVKQAKFVYPSGWSYRIGDIIYNIYSGFKFDLPSISGFSKWKSKNTEVTFNYDKVNIYKTSYIFFPMQVSNDSQIILNSDIGIFEALEYAINKAKKQNVELIVKRHPADPNQDILKKLLYMRNVYGFKLVDYNTFDVIKNSKSVITINSTVALEAKILGKEVDILGRSYYKYLNHGRIKSYILRHLVDIDFFSNEAYTVEQVKRIFDLCEFENDFLLKNKDKY